MSFRNCGSIKTSLEVSLNTKYSSYEIKFWAELWKVCVWSIGQFYGNRHLYLLGQEPAECKTSTQCSEKKLQESQVKSGHLKLWQPIKNTHLLNKLRP